MYEDNEILAEPADVLVLLSLFNEMDKRPTDPFVPHGALRKLIEGKSIQDPDELIDSLYKNDTQFVSFIEVEDGDKDSHSKERYYTLTLEGIRWIFANTDHIIELTNYPDWKFPEHLVAKLWTRRIEFELPTIPSSDRYVTIDHNSREFADLSTALDKAEDEIRGNNELAHADPRAKDEAISSIKAIRELLTPHTIAIGVVTSFVLPTLYKIADRIGDYVSDVTIQTVIELTKALFGT